jgi:predicted adenylyl cyclase CyaB
MEVELRARIKDPQKLEENLQKLSGIREIKSSVRQVDVYLRHESDRERKLVIRIRKNYKNDDGWLTFKARSSEKEDIAWEDFDTTIKGAEKLERLLVSNGYVYVCLVDKIRQSFQYEDFEINVDKVRDLGLFIEIEKQGEKTEVPKLKKEIKALLSQLGIAEEAIVEKGYVPLILEQQA